MVGAFTDGILAVSCVFGDGGNGNVSRTGSFSDDGVGHVEGSDIVGGVHHCYY